MALTAMQCLCQSAFPRGSPGLQRYLGRFLRGNAKSVHCWCLSHAEKGVFGPAEVVAHVALEHDDTQIVSTRVICHSAKPPPALYYCAVLHCTTGTRT